jgi:hypothetical protein
MTFQNSSNWETQYGIQNNLLTTKDNLDNIEFE